MKMFPGVPYVTPEQLATRVKGIARQEAARTHKESKEPIAEQMKAARQQAQEQRGPEPPKKETPDRDDR